MNRRGPFILILILLSGCNQSQDEHTINTEPVTEIPEHLRDIENLTVYSTLDDTEPVFQIELIRDQVFGDTDDVLVGAISGIEVDEFGRVFIPDLEQATIHVFNPDGSYLTNIGRSGEGPGEFSGLQLGTPIFSDEKSLYVYDSQPRRINVYSLETMSSIDTIYLNSESVSKIEEIQRSNPMLYSVRYDGLFIFVFYEWFFQEGQNPASESFDRYFLMDRSGRLIQPEGKIFEGKSSPLIPSRLSMSFPQFFTRRTLMDVAMNDHLFSAYSEEFLVREYDQNGDYLRSFYYPYNNRSLTRQQAINEVSENSQDAVRNFENIPETWPALNTLQVDDENRLWISTITEDDETYDWYVMNSDGELLGRFNWPRNYTRFFGERQIQLIKNGFVYMRERNESGVEQIIRYQIIMEENTSENE